MEKTFKTKLAVFASAALIVATLAPLGGTAGAQTVGQPQPNTQVPQPDQNSVNWPGAGYGAGALFGNVLYIPAKLTYALLGGIIGGGTYLVTAGNTQAANTVWRSSLGGDYVLTPQMVAGKQPINFSGPTATPPPVNPAAGGSSSASSNVAPIEPLPPTTVGSSSPTSGPGQALDHGSGPASGTSIE